MVESALFQVSAKGGRKRWRKVLSDNNAAPACYSMQMLNVEYSPIFNCLEDEHLKDSIGVVWNCIQQKALASDCREPYDAPKFRLAGLSNGYDRLTFRIGLTSYREYLAYRTSAGLRHLAYARARSLCVPVESFMPNTIGNVAIILTKDSQSIAVRRSRKVSTYAGYFDLPGGHPEPSRVPELSQNRSSQIINQSILDELFGSVRREVCEDLSVPLTAMGTPVLLTVLENFRDIRTPDMVFLLPVQLTTTELCHHFQKGSSTHIEVADIALFSPFEADGISELYPQTPIMEGALCAIQPIASRIRGEL